VSLRCGRAIDANKKQTVRAQQPSANPSVTTLRETLSPDGSADVRVQKRLRHVAQTHALLLLLPGQRLVRAALEHDCLPLGDFQLLLT
jgi:hypothetical protein